MAEKTEEKYSIFAVMGKSHKDLRRALLRDLRANGDRNLETLETQISQLSKRLSSIDRRLKKIESELPK